MLSVKNGLQEVDVRAMVGDIWAPMTKEGRDAEVMTYLVMGFLIGVIVLMVVTK